MLKTFFSVALMGTALVTSAQTSALLGFDAGGKLTYVPDAKGNVIPDFSYVGYHHNEVPLPSVPVVMTISPVGGDNRSHIQNAIDAVEAMTPDANGHRGALLLQAGTYNVNGTLTINTSGVVIRGEGNSTIVNETANSQVTLFQFSGSGGTSDQSSTERAITDSYVAIGQKNITVTSGHSFNVGDRVYLEREPNQAWIDLLGMGDLSSSDPGDTDWTPSAYRMKYKRMVDSVNGNVITLDAPVVDPIDPTYSTGSLYKYTWSNRLEEVGIENIRLESDYAHDTDENHGWHAVGFTNTENGWMENVNAYYFGYSCANISTSSYKITVRNCSMNDPKSQTTGGRKYSFNCNGQQCLFEDCYAWGGRHDYVSGPRIPGPNVFVNCVSENQKSTTGPHHRWATGQLYDNVSGDDDFAAENRMNSGSGHGWAGAQIMFWNCTTTEKFVMHDPPGDHVNWCIGCTGTITNNGFASTEPLAYVESQNNPLLPSSLYHKQLCDRLGTCAGQYAYDSIIHVVPGTIQLEEYDEGGSLVAYSDDSPGNNGGYFRNDDVDIDTTTDVGGGYNLGWNGDDEWVEYTVNVTSAGYYDFTLRGASDNIDGGGVHFEFDGLDLSGRIQVNNTGGWQNWQDFSVSAVQLNAGQQVMRMYIEEGSINLNYVSITPSNVDCNGDPGGSASVDFCGVCSGGLTGITPGSQCPMISSLTLIEGGTTNPIAGYDPLDSADIVDRNSLTETLFNVFANVTNNPDSVVFDYDLNGDIGHRREQNAPYALRGDGGGYTTWSPMQGSYTVTVSTYLNGLQSDQVVVPFTVLLSPTGIENSQNDIQVHPNPANAIVYINNEKKDWKLVSPTGQMIHSGNSSSIDISSLSSGVYVLLFDSGIVRFVKE